MSLFDNEGGFDMNALLAQAQAMQAQLANAQEELAQAKVTGHAGSGLVSVVMTGAGEITEVRIDPTVVDPEDVETLGDLIVAATRDAREQIAVLTESVMPQVPDLPF